MLALALTASLALGCETPAKTLELEALLDDTDVAFARADLPGFRAAIDAADARLPCVDEVVPQALVTRLHRAQGLAAWFRDAPAPAREAFAAARRLDPDAGFDANLVPEGHPLLDAYTALPLPADAEAIVLPPPAEGSLRVDGRRLAARPPGLPSLFQRLDGSGTVVATAYLWPGEPVPPYPLVTHATDVAPEPVVTPSATARHLRIGAVAAGVGAVLLYGGAAMVHQRYDATDTPTERLDGLRTANNGLVVGSGASLAVGIGLGVASLRF